MQVLSVLRHITRKKDRSVFGDREKLRITSCLLNKLRNRISKHFRNSMSNVLDITFSHQKEKSLFAGSLNFIPGQ